MKTIYKKLLFLLLFMPICVLAQGTLSGTVLDSKSNQPIPGVNVVIQGSTMGTQTDFDGKYNLPTLKKGDKIIFSYLGYSSQIISFTNQVTLNISLVEDANLLQEVVVQVGYGSVRKKDATGAVDLVSAKDFNKGAIVGVEGLLSGRAAGVVVTSSGTPGNDPVIRIRGGSSLLASNDPLIVIDGLPIDGGLSAINPNDIESFSILKDASATAIYGNRGSNGVILITTKRGSKKEMQVSFNTFTTLNTLAKKIDVYSADEYRTLINEKAPLKANLLGNSKTDWQNEIFSDSYTSDINLSVMGNLFDKVPSRLTIGNTDNSGVLNTSNFKRSTASIALNPSFLDDHLKLNITGNYSYTFRQIADEGAIGSAISYDPTQSVYNPTSIFNGYTEWFNSGQPKGTSNPVSLLKDKRNVANQFRFFGNINIDYKFHFLPELKAVINAGMDKQDGDGSLTINPLSRSGYNNNPNLPTNQIGSYSNTWYHNKNENLNAQLNYTKAIGKWNVDLLAGYEYQQFDWQNYYSGNKKLFGLGVNEEAKEDVYTDPGNNLQAFFGRLNLGFNDKYLMTFNFRRDGSTRVSPVNKWANFPGVAFAWKMKEESFLRDSKTFSDLKLRLSYGETGQQNLGTSLAWIKKYSTSKNNYYQFGNEFVVISKPDGYNESLKWERSAKYNAGLDFGFIDNRLKGSIDGYFSKTTDLFANTKLGALQNLGVYGPTNIGSLESKGIDFGLNYDAVQKDNFTLGINYNFTYNKTKITALATDNDPQGGVGLGAFVQTHTIGLSPFSFRVYEQVYTPEGRPIEGVFVDRNGDGKIDSSDQYNYHKPQADITMGLMFNGTLYKNWDYSMAWRASLGNYVYDDVNAGRAFLGTINDTFNQTINNSPIDYSNTSFIAASKQSDYYIKNASFLKLDNITIGYNFKSVFQTDKYSLRLYGGVQNVLTITDYKGIDPEVFNNGIDGTIFPRARMFMLGVNANF
ncbi:SusC/RagA family TonB-linked outer membrane protein [Flavobacterium cellulosilyticum]|uniref:SusC/RagA family TonB-linked outer membrane protein n=1 Tax=Flavobacterium cellulosilyticum TaxID=2541731 RepID=A0A4R5CJD9_9FLAO|nr:SusC/RagA family TonB-linked outer membrane protein [Flavobacterium cellulosilyticum]TDD99249.1 SusC/RagA family TonB-linked outer membrane protein [Flavobacterium cellulosilyticum]